MHGGELIRAQRESGASPDVAPSALAVVRGRVSTRQERGGLLTTLAGLVAIWSSFTSDVSSQPSGRLETSDRWRWSHYGLGDGLPAVDVHRLIETGDGRVLALTPKGIATFDGIEFRSWDPASLPIPTADGIVSLGSTRIALWKTDSVVVHDGEKTLFHYTRPSSGSPSGSERSILSVAPWEGGTLILELNGGARREHSFELLDVDSGTARPLEDVPIGRTGYNAGRSHLYPTAAGNLYLATDEGIYRRRDSQWTLLLKTPPEAAGSIHPHVAESQNGLGVATIRSFAEPVTLWAWSNESEPHRFGQRGFDLVSALAIAPNGVMIVAQESGRIVQCREKTWSTLRTLPLSAGIVRSMMIDRDGALWLATPGGAYRCRISTERWISVPSDNPIGDEETFARVHSIHRSPNSHLWLGTPGGVREIRPDGTTNDHVEAEQGPPLDEVTGIGSDQDGQLWVTSGAAFTGAYRWDGHSWHHVELQEGSPVRYHRIVEDRSGRLWFLPLAHTSSSVEVAAPMILENGRFIPFERSSALESPRVYDMDEEPDGTLWFATANGLARIRKDDVRKWNHATGLVADRVFCVALDDRGRAWFGHQPKPGLGVIDPGEEDVRYVGDTRDTFHAVWDVAKDSRGWMWATTNRGLVLYRDGVASSFGLREGLVAAPLWALLPEDDRVMVGTLASGACALELRSLDRTPPRIRISPPLEGSIPRLSWSTTSAHGEQHPQDIETRSRIDEGPWSPWSLERLVEPELSAGPHTLQVQAKGLLGDIDESGTKVTFHVPFPFWQRTEFLVPIALSLSALSLTIGLMIRRKRIHAKEIRESQTRYRELFENAHDLMFTVSAGGRLTSLNSVAEKRWQCPREAAIGMSIDAFVPTEHQPTIRTILAKALDSKISFLRQIELQASGGDRFWVEVSISAMATSEGLQCIARDLTERKNLEVQLLQSQKMEAIGRLAGGIAHDFNNLLTAINGYSDLVLQILDDDTSARDPILKIQHAGERAASLTKQLLTFSRKEVREDKIVDMNALLEDMEGMLDRLLGEDITLRIHSGEDLGLVRVDPGQLQQTILNLVVNSRDAMPEGGLIRIETRNREVASGERSTFAQLSVMDTGAGMTDEVRAQAFEPFFTTKEAGKGTGLGLSTVYGSIREYGGDLEIESEPDCGTQITISLPIVEGATLPSPDPQQAPQTEHGGDETILVVEDEEDVRDLLRRILERRGYRVLVAENGDHAMRLTAKLEGKLDLLLTDVVMPGMSGPETAERVLLLQPESRVLYISGYADRKLFQKTRRRLAPGAPTPPLLSKPFRAQELLSKIRETLDSSSSAKA